MYGTFSTAGSDGTVSFWDKDSKQRLKPFSNVNGTIPCTTFNRNGTIFAYAISYDWSKVNVMSLERIESMLLTFTVLGIQICSSHQYQQDLPSCRSWWWCQATCHQKAISLGSALFIFPLLSYSHPILQNPNIQSKQWSIIFLFFFSSANYNFTCWDEGYETMKEMGNRMGGAYLTMRIGQWILLCTWSTKLPMINLKRKGQSFGS